MSVITGHGLVVSPSYVGIPIPPTANTKGSWANVATLPRDVNWVTFTLWGPTTAGTGASSLVDIGIAAGAGTQVVVPNVFYSLRGSDGRGMPAALPLYLPAGTIVRARVQNSQTSGTELGSRWAFHWVNGLPACTRWTTFGADTANSRGTGLSTSSKVSLGTLPFGTRWAWQCVGPAQGQSINHSGHGLFLYIDDTPVDELFVLWRPASGEAAEAMGRLIPLVANAGSTLMVQSSVLLDNTIYVTVTVGG